MLGSLRGVGAQTTRSRETVSSTPEPLMMIAFFADVFTTRYGPVAKDASLFRSGSTFFAASRRKKTNDPSRMSSADDRTALSKSVLYRAYACRRFPLRCLRRFEARQELLTLQSRLGLAGRGHVGWLSVLVVY